MYWVSTGSQGRQRWRVRVQSAGQSQRFDVTVARTSSVRTTPSSVHHVGPSPVFGTSIEIQSVPHVTMN